MTTEPNQEHLRQYTNSYKAVQVKAYERFPLPAAYEGEGTNVLLNSPRSLVFTSIKVAIGKAWGAQKWQE